MLGKFVLTYIHLYECNSICLSSQFSIFLIIAHDHLWRHMEDFMYQVNIVLQFSKSIRRLSFVCIWIMTFQNI